LKTGNDVNMYAYLLSYSPFKWCL